MKPSEIIEKCKKYISEHGDNDFFYLGKYKTVTCEKCGYEWRFSENEHKLSRTDECWEDHNGRYRMIYMYQLCPKCGTENFVDSKSKY